MAPAVKKMQISQETFDSVVKENVEDLGMDEAEAVADAITTFNLQGVDLTGIITDGGGAQSLVNDPIVLAIESLRTVVAKVNQERSKPSANAHGSCNDAGTRDARLTPELEADIISSLSTLQLKCCDLESGDISRAATHGGVEALLDTCKMLAACKSSSLGNALAALAAALKGMHNSLMHQEQNNLNAFWPCLITDERARDKFGQSFGPEIVYQALILDQTNDTIVQHGAFVVSSACLKNEDAKDSFVSLKVHEILSDHLKRYQTFPAAVLGICDALRSLVTADDDRIAVSRAFQNGMLIAKAGVVDTLLEVATHQEKSTAVLPSLCIALKNLAVNDEICKSIAESGGLQLVIKFMNTSVEQNHRTMARTSCILLMQLSCSDANKDAIVQRHDGLRHIVDLATCFSNDASVVQEALTAMAVLTLRSPVNASEAVKFGAVDLTAEMMERHSGSAPLQRQSCQLIRNLAVRNPENRPIILERGFEKLVRQAKANHELCRDAASAALRDLGFPDYNS